MFAATKSGNPISCLLIAEDAHGARPPAYCEYSVCRRPACVALLSHGGDQAAVGQRPGTGDKRAHDAASDEQNG